MKGKVAAVILLPRHLLMDWKSRSGLDIVGDTFGREVQVQQCPAGLNWKEA